MDYPSTIQIETAASCNAACGFCPHSTMARSPRERMSTELFTKLLGELASWPVPPTTLCPFLTNEPFADPRIYDFCQHVNQRLPDTQLAFFTNGSLFTEGNLDKLATLHNISLIHVSLHHWNATAYEADLHLDFERTLTSIHRLIDRQRWPVRLGRVQNGDATEDSRFLEFCAAEFPSTPACLSYRYNWKGDIASSFPAEPTLDIVCPRHTSMTVLCDGRVALCCLDQSGDYALGDANVDTLASIYNSEMALAYRSATKRFATPCKTCNMHA